MRLNAAMRIAGVIAADARRSFSPQLHNFWLAHYRINGVYLPLSITEPDNFERCFLSLPALGFTGCNITIPYKQQAAALCTTLDPVARRIGAVNTVTFLHNEPALIHGGSSDGDGFVAGLRAHTSAGQRQTIPGTRTVVFGAGGAAVSVIDALLALEPDRHIVLYNRTPRHGDALIRRMQSFYPRARLESAGLQTDLGTGVDIRLIINTLPPHVWRQQDAGSRPALPPVDGCLCYDLSYAETPFLDRCREAGQPAAVISGHTMLVRQAASGFHNWFGIPLKPDDFDAGQKLITATA